MKSYCTCSSCCFLNACSSLFNLNLIALTISSDLEDWSDKDSNEATHFRSFLSETLRSIKICSSYAFQTNSV